MKSKTKNWKTRYNDVSASHEPNGERSVVVLNKVLDCRYQIMLHCEPKTRLRKNLIKVLGCRYQIMLLFFNLKPDPGKCAITAFQPPMNKRRIFVLFFVLVKVPKCGYQILCFFAFKLFVDHQIDLKLKLCSIWMYLCSTISGIYGEIQKRSLNGKSKDGVVARIIWMIVQHFIFWFP